MRLLYNLWKYCFAEAMSSTDPEKALPAGNLFNDERIPHNRPNEDELSEAGGTPDLPLEKLPSGTAAAGENTLMKTLSIVRTRDSGTDPGPPPDGGFHAWLQTILAHLVICNTWGYINSFGVFQSYYTTSLNRSPSDISWVGSMQVFLLFFIGTFSGRATDAGFFKAVWILGAFLVIFGIFMTSLCTTYWQLFLAQALCMGIGSGMLFCPTIAIISTYFSSKRAIALAISACGSATGGLIFPGIIQRLLPTIGFPWTMRVLGFFTLATMAPGFFFLRQRLPPRKSGAIIDWGAFKELPYSLYGIAMFLNFWSLYIGFFYVSSFGRNVIGVSQSTSISLLLVMNGVGMIGRMLPSFISDFYAGPFNTLIPFAFISGIMLFGWIGISDTPSMWVFSALYGFFAAGIQSLFPAALSTLTTDLKKAGIRFGMVLSIVGLASLTGSPIAGALVQVGGGNYLYAQLFAALSMMVGTSTLVAARISRTGMVLRKKV